MRSLEELIREQTNLSVTQVAHLQHLASDWQLIADLSFADLAIWVPIKRSLEELIREQTNLSVTQVAHLQHLASD